MKTADKCAIAAAIAGLVAGLGSAWYGGSLTLCIIVGLVVTGALYAGMLKQIALENVANLRDRMGDSDQQKNPHRRNILRP